MNACSRSAALKGVTRAVFQRGSTPLPLYEGRHSLNRLWEFLKMCLLSNTALRLFLS